MIRPARPYLVKHHLKDCARTEIHPTRCRCPWWTHIGTHKVELAKWYGQDVDPLKRREAKRVSDVLYSLAWCGVFSPHGYKQSIGLQELLTHPYRAFDLHPSQVPAFLRQTEELITNAIEVKDKLAWRIPGDQRVSGRSLRDVRSVLRLDHGTGFSYEDAQSALARHDARSVRRLLADVVTDGWVKQDSPDHWLSTPKARELTTKSRGRLSRARAEALLVGLMERVRVINGDPKYAYRVDALVVFGSYLTARPKIGDVDLGIRLKVRRHGKVEQKALEAEARKRCPRIATFLGELGFPEIEVRRFLKNRTGYLEFHDISELDELARLGTLGRYEVIHGYWNPPSEVPHGRTLGSADDRPLG